MKVINDDYIFELIQSSITNKIMIYNCHKCGIKIDHDSEDYSFTSTNDKTYYLMCSDCHD